MAIAIAIWTAVFLLASGEETDVSIELFNITGPSNLNYSHEYTSSVTFEMELVATMSDTTVTDVYLYFADEDKHYSSMRKHERFSLDENIAVNLEENIRQYITASADVYLWYECEKYNYTCVYVIVSDPDYNINNDYKCNYVDQSLFVCPDRWLEDFKILAPSNIMYTVYDAVQITFTFTFGAKFIACDHGYVQLYFTYNNTEWNHDSVSSIGDIVQPDSSICSDIRVTWATASVQLPGVWDEQCRQCDNICLAIGDDNDSDTTNNFLCLPLGVDSEAGIVKCPEFHIEYISATTSNDGNVYKPGANPVDIEMKVNFSNVNRDYNCYFHMYVADSSDYYSSIYTASPFAQYSENFEDCTTTDYSGTYSVWIDTTYCSLYTHLCVVPNVIGYYDGSVMPNVNGYYDGSVFAQSYSRCFALQNSGVVGSMDCAVAVAFPLWAIIVISAGGGTVLLITIIVISYCCCKSKKNKRSLQLINCE